MVQSMTGYGSAEMGDFRVEIRSLNHRFMDITLRMPPDLIKYDIPLRNIIRERFSRGKFDITITFLPGRGSRIGVDLNRAMSLYNALNSLGEELRLQGGIRLETMAMFRDMILREEFEYDVDSLFGAFEMALNNLTAMREEEGRNLRNDLESRVGMLLDMKDHLASISSEAVAHMRERFIERIKSLLGDAKIDEERVLQEVAILVEKADISEEITRIDSHLRQMRRLLSEGDTIGRKLEFILQELFREVNTISSKTSDFRVSSIIVEMKAEIERMREQSQNIQ